MHVSSSLQHRCAILIYERPILTYKGQNTTKGGVKSEDHAIVYLGAKKVVNGVSQISGSNMCSGIINVKYDNVGRFRTRNEQDLKGSSRGLEKLICEDCGGYKFTCENDTGTESRGFSGISRKALALLNVGSGLAMSASFLWLNASMGLENPSPAINWVRTHAIIPGTLY
jgi:hypothetical protein